jgi:hypothetical protein
MDPVEFRDQREIGAIIHDESNVWRLRPRPRMLLAQSLCLLHHHARIPAFVAVLQ